MMCLTVECALLYTLEYECSESVSIRMSTVAHCMQCPPSMLTLNKSLLNTDDKALDVTSQWSSKL